MSNKTLTIIYWSIIIAFCAAMYFFQVDQERIRDIRNTLIFFAGIYVIAVVGTVISNRKKSIRERRKK